MQYLTWGTNMFDSSRITLSSVLIINIRKSNSTVDNC
jgi:hypothetical protein